MHRTTCLAALVASTALGAGLALATVSVERVTIGTSVELFAPSDVAFEKKRPKVTARYIGPVENPTGKKPKTPKLKLKITELNQGSVETVVKTAKGAGVFEIQVTPKEPGATPFIAGTVTSMLPAPTSVTPPTAGRKTELVIAGTFFGAKKPKVTIGGKKAKVLAFSDTELRVRAHKKTPSGSADLLVKTKVGESGLIDAVVIDDEGGGGGGGGDPGDGDFVRFLSRGDARIKFDTEVNMTGAHTGPTGFSIAALDNVREQTLDIVTTFDLDSFAGRPRIDIDPAKGEKFEVRAHEGGELRTYSVVQPSDGTSATVTVLSFDPVTLTVVLDFDAELLSVATGDRIAIRSGRAQVTLNDHRP